MVEPGETALEEYVRNKGVRQPEGLEDILEEYGSLFEPTQGLQPQRIQDHSK